MSLKINQSTIKNTAQQDVQGLIQLHQEGFTGVVDLVESMHQRIMSLGGLLSHNPNQTKGIPRLVYQSIRHISQLSFKASAMAIGAVQPWLPKVNDKSRNQWVSILNGVLGDHLVRTHNPLAIEMTWIHEGQAISPQQAALACQQQQAQPLFMIHGLCMNDQMWTRKQHNHGQLLAEEYELFPIYLRYNSGLAIHENGQQLAQMLNVFQQSMTTPFQMRFLCHSMGGLVMRSAIHTGLEKHSNWVQHIQQVLFLGTPHQGAVLEKSGHLLEYLISISPYSAPFLKITQIRSQGIKDLRQAKLTPSHQHVQLPKHISSHAFAASLSKQDKHKTQKGDGLVTVNSALGKHHDTSKSIHFDSDKQHLFIELSHLDLLSDKRVYDRLKLLMDE